MKEQWWRAQKSPDSVAVADEPTRILRAATVREKDRTSIQQERNCYYAGESSIILLIFAFRGGHQLRFASTRRSFLARHPPTDPAIAGLQRRRLNLLERLLYVALD
jgi:hypothetical protein